jgi:extracellular elastinolytic metalloproteinase
LACPSTTRSSTNVNREGRLLSVNNSFLPGIARAAGGWKPVLDLAAAAARRPPTSGVSLKAAPQVIESADNADSGPVVDDRAISLAPIRGRLMWLPIRAGMARLVWNFEIQTLDTQHWYDMTVDAIDGRVWTRFDHVASDSYRVYARPAESPNHVSPLPPADGRTTVTNSAFAAASPFGWRHQRRRGASSPPPREQRRAYRHRQQQRA